MLMHVCLSICDSTQTDPTQILLLRNLRGELVMRHAPLAAAACALRLVRGGYGTYGDFEKLISAQNGYGA